MKKYTMKLIHNFTLLTALTFVTFSCYGMDSVVASGFFGQANLTSNDDSTEKPSISPRMELVQKNGLMSYLINKISAAQHEDGSFSDIVVKRDAINF